jgi:hypothetical protein
MKIWMVNFWFEMEILLSTLDINLLSTVEFGNHLFHT